MIGIAFLAIALLWGSQCGCGATVQPSLTGDGNVLEMETDQVVNNPYPWMWTILGIVLLIFIYLYFDKRYTRFGRR